LIRNKQKKNFEYKSKGQMAIIGKRSGIASVFGMNIHGFLAWWLWRSVYLSKISRLENCGEVSICQKYQDLKRE